ncbi:major facilitator superfamily domain-containing protein [Fusarium oxysporum]|nr:major facilitator superfamily domain-containing protein [Fusarium oxysporum]
MLTLGAVLQVIAHALRSWKPPFPLFTITFWLASLGQAYQDTHGNTYVSGVKGSHRWLAFIHAMYMAGCLVGPFVATGVASAGSTSRWYLFYTFPLGIGVLNVAFVVYAFWDTLRLKRKQPPTERTLEADESPASRNDDAFSLIKETLKNKNVWLISLFFFFFLGATLTASGWVVEYLVEVRNGDINQMGFVPAGFSGGSLLGRLFLAEPTHRFGVRPMIFAFTILSIGLQVLFWLVPNIIAASIAISLLGFFMGPYFATGISVGSKLFNPRIQSTALAFLFVFAQLGGCLFPIITGLIAASAGVSILQPVLCALLVATSVSWLSNWTVGSCGEDEAQYAALVLNQEEEEEKGPMTLFTTNELLLAELHPVTQPLSLLRLTVLLLPTLQALLQHQQARTSAKETPTALPLRVATITILPSAPGNTHHISLYKPSTTNGMWPHVVGPDAIVDSMASDINDGNSDMDDRQLNLFMVCARMFRCSPISLFLPLFGLSCDAPTSDQTLVDDAPSLWSQTPVRQLTQILTHPVFKTNTLWDSSPLSDLMESLKIIVKQRATSDYGTRFHVGVPLYLFTAADINNV